MEQTEPGAGLAFAALIDCIWETILPEKPAETPTRKQKLMGIIEDLTLNSRFGRSYHKGLHMALREEYTASEINQAIRTLRKKRVLNEHHDGPYDTAYSHNNKFKSWIAGLTYL